MPTTCSRCYSKIYLYDNNTKKILNLKNVLIIIAENTFILEINLFIIYIPKIEISIIG